MIWYDCIVIMASTFITSLGAGLIVKYCKLPCNDENNDITTLK